MLILVKSTRWTKLEDDRLWEITGHINPRATHEFYIWYWQLVKPILSKELPGRSYRSCKERHWKLWYKEANPGKSQPPPLSRWSDEEDKLLLELVSGYGDGDSLQKCQWQKISDEFPRRAWIGCRLRFCNLKRPTGRVRTNSKHTVTCSSFYIFGLT